MLKISFISPLLIPALLSGTVRWTGPTRHDFGVVERGRPVRHAFTFTNTGDAPLTVETVRTTCGCTVPEWPKHPVLPDSSAQITVIYDAQKKGPFRKTITVYFYEIRQGQRLYVEGTVR